jgi:hypothetical protein
MHRWREIESSGHDAYHNPRLTIERNGFSNYSAIPAEAPLPETVTENYFVVATSLILAGEKVAAEHGLYAEYRKEIGGDWHATDLLGVAGAGESEFFFVDVNRGHVLKASALLLEVGEVSLRDGYLREALGWETLPEHYEASGVVIGQGAKEHRIQQCEDGGVRADAEPENQDDDGREAGAAAEEVDGVAGIVGVEHGGFNPRLVLRFAEIGE